MPETKSPALVVIDVQREYVTPGRPFHLAGIAPSLANAKALLDHARAQGWPVVHVQHLQDGAVFQRGSEAADFVPGFEPLPGEEHVVKGRLSAYAAPEFQAAMDRLQPGHEVHVVGYGSTMCCMATILAGGAQGHRFTFVADASLARANAAGDEQEAHRHATAILGIHAKVTDAAAILAPRQLAA